MGGGGGGGGGVPTKVSSARPAITNSTGLKRDAIVVPPTRPLQREKRLLNLVLFLRSRPTRKILSTRSPVTL